MPEEPGGRHERLAEMRRDLGDMPESLRKLLADPRGFRPALPRTPESWRPEAGPPSLPPGPAPQQAPDLSKLAEGFENLRQTVLALPAATTSVRRPTLPALAPSARALPPGASLSSVASALPPAPLPPARLTVERPSLPPSLPSPPEGMSRPPALTPPSPLPAAGVSRPSLAGLPSATPDVFGRPAQQNTLAGFGDPAGGGLAAALAGGSGGFGDPAGGRDLKESLEDLTDAVKRLTDQMEGKGRGGGRELPALGAHAAAQRPAEGAEYPPLPPRRPQFAPSIPGR